MACLPGRDAFGEPLAVSAGIATLEALRAPARLAQGLLDAAVSAGVSICGTRVGSMMTSFFTSGLVADYATACRADTRMCAAFFRTMLEQGVYLAPSQFECAFVSLAHSDEDIAKTLNAAEKAYVVAKASSTQG